MARLRIKDLGTVVTGSTPSTKVPEYFGNGYPFIKPPDLSESIRSVARTETELSELGARSQWNRLLPAETTCVVCIGTIGKIGLTTKPSFSNQQINSVIVDRQNHDPVFVYYLLRQAIPLVKQLNAGSASGRENVNKSTFENITLDVPPKAVQKRVATVLSTFDDLIENNIRRIKLIEEMARLLYREWIVKFQFPGHKQVKFVNSEIGLIPENWKVVKFSEAVFIDPPVSLPKGRPTAFVPMTSISNESMVISDVEERSNGSGSKFQNGDTLLARITPCLENGKTGYVQFLPDDSAVACGSTEFVVLRSKLLFPGMVYLMARSDEVRSVAIKSMSGATGRQRVRKECFDNLLVAVPPPKFASKMADIIEPKLRLAQALHEENANLQRQRDMLLPRLIEGKIREVPVSLQEEVCTA